MVEAFVYINLDKRKDRRAEMEAQLQPYQIPATRFTAIATPDRGIVGCGYSHLEVLKTAKAQKYKNVCIIEDDFEIIVSKEAWETQIRMLFETHPEFDVCMCSYNLHECEELNPSHPELARVKYAQTASCYIVQEHYYDKLIELYSWAIPQLEQTGMHWVYANDVIWKQLQQTDHWVYFKQRLGKQRAGYSDNAQSYQDHGC